VRTRNSAAQALLERLLAGEKIPAIPLVFMDLDVPQYWALCSVALTWGGHTWEPLDIAIGSVSDSVQQADGIRFTLPGATSAQLALAAQDVEGAAVTIYLAWVDPDTAEVADAIQLWAGELDQPGWQDGPTALAHFRAEPAATIALRDRVSRYTDDEQQRLHSGDTSLDVDPLTDAAPLIWPSASYYRV
jgi:hypothetical protein